MVQKLAKVWWGNYEWGNIWSESQIVGFESHTIYWLVCDALHCGCREKSLHCIFKILHVRMLVTEHAVEQIVDIGSIPYGESSNEILCLEETLTYCLFMDHSLNHSCRDYWTSYMTNSIYFDHWRMIKYEELQTFYDICISAEKPCTEDSPKSSWLCIEVVCSRCAIRGTPQRAGDHSSDVIFFMYLTLKHDMCIVVHQCGVLSGM